MNYWVLLFALISIILVLISKFYGLSILYPTLFIIFTIIFDLISNTIRENKDRKEHSNISEIIDKKKEGLS